MAVGFMLPWPWVEPRIQASRHTQNTAGASARIAWAAMGFSSKAASCSAPKNISREPARPRMKNSHTEVLKIFRF